MLAAASYIGSLQGAMSSPWSVAVLMVYLQFNPVRPGACPSRCLCTSDILSCSDQGLDTVPGAIPISTVTLDLNHNQILQLEEDSFQGLLQLEVLRLAHNQLTTIQPGAFRNSSGGLLRHLDLSSNQLQTLKQDYFQDLPGLEELLLFNNRIMLVESTALSGLENLQKAYLSHNRLTDFPFFSIQGSSHPQLSLLDLSSNRLPKLPLVDINNLPTSLQKGLYLHNNSLVCDCSMYSLFRLWEEKDFASVRFFKQEHVCLVHGIQRSGIRFLHSRYFDKCNPTAAIEQEADVEVRLGAPLLLHCITSLSGNSVTFFWIVPDLEYVDPPGNNKSIKMFKNGSLEVVAAQMEDAGIYVCMAQNGQRNESREVNVTVLPRHDDEAAEPFNTGFTTLLGCVVSLLLVLIYLYLTPCRCPPCLRPRPPVTATLSQSKEGGAGSAQSSILTPTPPTTTEGPGRKVSTNKRVGFLEPIREQQNGRLRGGAGFLLGAEPQQRAAETNSYVSVFPDTPIMLP
ncbi:PREDICTED: amphoterin-induced protein 3-like [Cyprinodon variegatus]|uniref:Adhesion molecule with Ig-like domain 3 n=1 Tax=Cyprinodon variegatus TaxID=28743 RepID=A0A3Q2CAI8_CYPVA|nr:PREDICTED: amphoterin-induced protein 3-like [Cyprinodon variegatus]